MGYQKLGNISKGWLNVMRDVTGTLPPQIRQMSMNRMSICESCPLRNGNICDKNRSGAAVRDFVYHGEQRRAGNYYNGCGCPLVAKTKVPEEKCPIGKW